MTLRLSEFMLHQTWKEAVIGGQVEACQLLLSQGADIEYRDRDGFTAVHLALRNGRVKLLNWLIEQGCDVLACDDIGNNLMHTLVCSNLLAWQSHGDPFGQLIKLGVPLNARNNHQQTPLEMAIWIGKEDMTRSLVRAGADLEATDAKGKSALHGAMQVESIAFADILVEGGAQLAARDACGRTPVQHACSSIELANEVCGFLIKWRNLIPPSLLCARDNKNKDCLHEVVWIGHVELTATLIALGAQVTPSLLTLCEGHPHKQAAHMMALLGSSPLEAAVRIRKPEVLQAHLERFPEPDDAQLGAAIKLAAEMKSPQILAMLQSHQSRQVLRAVQKMARATG